jgi:hypothetical protein
MLRLVAFDRIEKPWMTLSGGGDDELIEWPEFDWSLVDYPRGPSERRNAE